MELDKVYFGLKKEMGENERDREQERERGLREILWKWDSKLSTETGNDSFAHCCAFIDQTSCWAALPRPQPGCHGDMSWYLWDVLQTLIELRFILR